jgi:hypothetical protein
MIRVSQGERVFWGETDTDDGLDSVHGHPSFPRVLIAILIVAGRVLG